MNDSEQELENILKYYNVSDLSDLNCKCIEGAKGHLKVDLIKWSDKRVREALSQAHRANDSHDSDNATDEYIDGMLDRLESNKRDCKDVHPDSPDMVHPGGHE